MSGSVEQKTVQPGETITCTAKACQGKPALKPGATYYRIRLGGLSILCVNCAQTALKNIKG